MKYRIKACEVGPLGIADVLADGGYSGNPSRGAKRAPAVQVAVVADDFVPALDHHRCEHRPDIAEVAGYEDAHRVNPTSSTAGYPDPKGPAAASCRAACPC